MKKDIYAHITTLVLAIAIGFSAFLVVTDNRLPFTTQATVKTLSIDVVPEVSGYIEEVMVTEGEAVLEGMPLLKIDDTYYQIVKQKAQASVTKADSEWQQAKRHLDRVQALLKSKSISKETVEDADIAVQEAQSALLIAQAELKDAERQLGKTQIVAQHSGTVTNLSYREGMYISAGSPAIHLIDDTSLWIDADFTEKGMSALTANQDVNVVFDAHPMEVFQGHIVSMDSAISSGVSSTSQVAQVTDETRWIRAQQKIRVRVAVDMEPNMVVAGSRASVMVRDNYHVSDTWMNLLSWMRYIY